MSLGFLRLLEGIRNPALDTFFSLITRLGEETAFMALAMAIFWCVSKRSGYLVFLVGFFGTLGNQFLKLTFRIPRPWVLDPSFTIVESAREAATGYSFPSGHTQNSVGTFGAIGVSVKKKWVRIACAVPVILVPLSRLYLGVHTPLDVGVAFGMALALIAVLYALFRNEKRWERSMPAVIAAVIVCALAYLIYVLCANFPADTDPHNLESGTKNAWTLMGCTVALPVIYFLDKKYIRFETRAVWYAQILKLVLGLGLAIGVKAALKAPLRAILPNGPADAVRYFLLVLVAGALWPMTFRFFSRMGKKKEEK